MKHILKSTKGQRDKIRNCNVGVGLLVYNYGGGSTVEMEVFIHPKTKQLCYIQNGKPIELDYTEEETA